MARSKKSSNEIIHENLQASEEEWEPSAEEIETFLSGLMSGDDTPLAERWGMALDLTQLVLDKSKQANFSEEEVIAAFDRSLTRVEGYLSTDFEYEDFDDEE